MMRSLGRLLGRKSPPVKLLRHSTLTQWGSEPVPPFTVQRIPGDMRPELVIVETWTQLDAAVLRAWDLIYPYQANMSVQVIDARDSMVFGRAGQYAHIQAFGVDGLWHGTQAAFSFLASMVDDEQRALVEFLMQKAKTATTSAVPA